MLRATYILRGGNTGRRKMLAGKTSSRKKRKVAIAFAGVAILATAILYSAVSSSAGQSGGLLAANPLADTTFPPPISGGLSAQPSYAVSISDVSAQSSGSVFSPSVISVPAGMTVIWSNGGAGQHTVTTVSGNGYTPPEAISSKEIAPDGGSFMHTFTKPGVYRYSDLSNPKASGIVDVGSAIQTGNNFDMQVGGMDELPGPHGVTLRFVPHTMTIPPTTAITYQVTVSDATGKLVTRNFDDTDGILDLELVPQGGATPGNDAATTPAQQFVTWGPDFAGEEGHGSTGTFHIQGPFMDAGHRYSVTVTALSRDNAHLDNISDTFSITPS
jgi:plastocyanin